MQVASLHERVRTVETGVIFNDEQLREVLGEPDSVISVPGSGGTTIWCYGGWWDDARCSLGKWVRRREPWNTNRTRDFFHHPNHWPVTFEVDRHGLVWTRETQHPGNLYDLTQIEWNDDGDWTFSW